MHRERKFDNSCHESLQQLLLLLEAATDRAAVARMSWQRKLTPESHNMLRRVKSSKSFSHCVYMIENPTAWGKDQHQKQLVSAEP